MRNYLFEFLESPSVRNVDIRWSATTAAIQIPNYRYVFRPRMLAHGALGPDLTELFAVGEKKNDVIPEWGPFFKARRVSSSVRIPEPSSVAPGADGVVVRHQEHGSGATGTS
jgi:hypothetical protein